MAADPAHYESDQLFVPSNGFAKFVGLRLFPFLKLPIHGLNFAFGTPPFGASPDAQHSAAIGKPNTDGLIGWRFWIIDHVWLGSHLLLVSEVNISIILILNADLRSSKKGLQGQFGPFWANSSCEGTTDPKRLSFELSMNWAAD
jgi:hypothetical protein